MSNNLNKYGMVILSEASIPIFIYKHTPYMKVVPAKRLFNSTMVHEVVTRGDFFAVDLLTGIFTVLPQGADCNHEQQDADNKQIREQKPKRVNKDLFDED